LSCVFLIIKLIDFRRLHDFANLWWTLNLSDESIFRNEMEENAKGSAEL